MRGPVVKRGARVGGSFHPFAGDHGSQESFIAAGALVNRDTEPGKVYIGVPARVLRDVPDREKLENQE